MTADRSVAAAQYRNGARWAGTREVSGPRPSTTRSARGCHLCLRYDLSPMCPGRTANVWCRGRDSNPRPPHYEQRTTRAEFEVSHAIPPTGDGACSVLVHPNPGRPLKPKPPDPEETRSPGSTDIEHGAKRSSAQYQIPKPGHRSRISLQPPDRFAWSDDGRLRRT